MGLKYEYSERDLEPSHLQLLVDLKKRKRVGWGIAHVHESWVPGGQVESLLEQIPELFARQQVVDAALGGAVDACIQLLKCHTGGRLHVFASTLPKVGWAPQPIHLWEVHI